MEASFPIPHMKRPSFAPETTKRMQALLKQAVTSSETKRIQCVLLGAGGLSSMMIAPVVGWGAVYVRTVWRNYKRDGEAAILGERRGKDRARAHLTVKQEQDFIKPILKEAARGGILIVPQVQDRYERRIGKSVHLPVIYNLLHRHGWRKITPRPHHPKADLEAQASFRSDLFPPGGARGASRSATKKHSSARPVPG